MSIRGRQLTACQHPRACITTLLSRIISKALRAAFLRLNDASNQPSCSIYESLLSCTMIHSECRCPGPLVRCDLAPRHIRGFIAPFWALSLRLFWYCRSSPSCPLSTFLLSSLSMSPSTTMPLPRSFETIFQWDLRTKVLRLFSHIGETEPQHGVRLSIPAFLMVHKRTQEKHRGNWAQRLTQ